MMYSCLFILASGGDYLKTMLIQAHDAKLPLQMKVIREQDPLPVIGFWKALLRIVYD